jgi:integrase
MLPFQVRRFKGRSRGRKGEDVVVLTDRRGSPDPYYYPNLFATNEYRQTRKSPNTTEKVLRSLGMATIWAAGRGRNLDEELSAGRFLDAADIIDLARFLSLSSADQTVEYRAVLPGTVIAPIRSAKPQGKLKRDAGSGKAEHSYDDVPAEEVGKRIRWVARYLEWHRRRRFDNRKLSEIEERLNTTAVSAITDLRNKAPGSPSDYSDAELLEAPDLALLQRIELIMQPGSADNPFQSAFVQSRNYLAWRIFADVPVRRGEVFTARTDSMDPVKRQFLVRISKTRARTVPISPQTVAAFERFFDDHWRNLPDGCPAHRTGELFTSKQGAPLTTAKVMNRIFEAIRPLIGPQPWKLSPHTMKRAWNHNFSVKVDAVPLEKRMPIKQQDDIRKRLNGWSEKSRQPARYNRRYNRDAGDKIVQQIADDIASSANPEKF